jgi:adenine-specific DNA-methyltransferase
MGDGIFVLDTAHEGDAAVIATFSAAERRLLKDFYKNSDIDRYRCQTTTTKRLLYVGRETPSLKNYPNVLKHLTKYKGILNQRREVTNGVIQFFQLQWPRDADIFEGRKIVVPYRSEIAAFAFNSQQWYCRSDCYVITEGNELYSLWYLLAILNSPIGYAWLYYKGKRKGSMLELFQVPLSEIPIATPPAKVKGQLEKLVEKRLGLAAGPAALAVEQEIDQVVYGLYGLTAEEIAIVEGSGKRKEHPAVQSEATE